MARSRGLEATKAKKVIADAIRKSKVRPFKFGVVAASDFVYADVFVDGDFESASEYYRIPGGIRVSPGAYVKVSTENRQILEVIPTSAYSKLDIDINEGKIYTGDGNSPALTEFSGGGGYVEPRAIVEDSEGEDIIAAIRRDDDSEWRFSAGISSDGNPYISFGDGESENSRIERTSSSYLEITSSYLNVAGTILQNGNPLPTGGSSGGGVSTDLQIFTTPGADTWVKPDGEYSIVRVICIGAGGGGGSGRRGSGGSNRGGGGGGAGGSMVTAQFEFSEVGDTEDLVVGSGGVGATQPGSNNSNGDSGTSGGGSYWGSSTAATSKVYAAGGAGGSGGTTGGGNGGSGGTSVISGGSGGTGSATGGSGANLPAGLGAAGGGGGGGINTANNGFDGGAGGVTLVNSVANPASGAVSGSVNADPGSDNFPNPGNGGGGGAGGSYGNQSRAGQKGGFPGGGGGGGAGMANGGTGGAVGGDGADGCVIVVCI